MLTELQDRAISLDGEPPHSRFSQIGRYEDHYENQIPGLCGPAIVRTVFKAALAYQTARGIPGGNVYVPTQHEISQNIFTGRVITEGIYAGQREYCLPVDLASYIGSGARYYRNATIDHMKYSVGLDIPTTILITENFPDEEDGILPLGHYLTLVGYNKVTDTFRVKDTSNARRLYDKEGYVILDFPKAGLREWEWRPEYKIRASDLAPRWHDTFTHESTGIVEKLNGVMITYDLSQITPPVLAA